MQNTDDIRIISGTLAGDLGKELFGNPSQTKVMQSYRGLCLHKYGAVILPNEVTSNNIQNPI